MKLYLAYVRERFEPDAILFLSSDKEKAIKDLEERAVYYSPDEWLILDEYEDGGVGNEYNGECVGAFSVQGRKSK